MPCAWREATPREQYLFDDGDPFLHHMVASAFVNLGEHDRAKHHLQMALSLNPRDFHVTLQVSSSLMLVLIGEGLAMVEQVFGLEPRLPPAFRAVP